jgi:hypothetical protein
MRTMMRTIAKVNMRTTTGIIAKSMRKRHFRIENVLMLPSATTRNNYLEEYLLANLHQMALFATSIYKGELKK